jgi:hypothetical protein
MRGPIEIESRICFLPMITPQSRYWLRLYAHYRHRLLPHRGALFDQPAVYLQAMELIETGIANDHARRNRNQS